MTTTIDNQIFNPVQLHLLKMFSFTKTEEGLQDLKAVLFDYYQKKLKRQADEFWDNNHLGSSQMETIMYGHNRISVK